MVPRFEAVKFMTAEIPTPVPGQEFDLRLSPAPHGWAVLDHDTKRAALFSTASYAMRATRNLNAGSMHADAIATLPTPYYRQLMKWSASHGQF